MSLVLNEPLVRTKKRVDLVDALRVGTGRAEMPRSWIALLEENDSERTLWLTDEQLRPPPPGE